MIRNVHQIVFTTSGSVDLTGYAGKAAGSVRSTFADHTYRLWQLEEASDFIATNLPEEVAQAFRTLTPFAYKADLFKFCLLKVLGGWVVDIGVRMLKTPLQTPIVDEDPEFVLFRSSGVWDPPWNCSIALLYARPGHVVFDTPIGWIVEHCRNRYYGHTPLMPTMATFGRAIAHHQVHENTRVGNVVDVRFRRFRRFGRAFELKPIGLVAARKPAGIGAGDIASIGVSGSNNYAALWRNRQVYGEQS